MKNIFYLICSKVAACALFAAVTSMGIASCGGMYQPAIPDSLLKREDYSQ